ncbi:hypothetical protein FM124_00140 [Pediococcus acidilactici]|nr:hypothetical protein FM124_00140 [Pediococcus acidilactici]
MKIFLVATKTAFFCQNENNYRIWLLQYFLTRVIFTAVVELAINYYKLIFISDPR